VTYWSFSTNGNGRVDSALTKKENEISSSEATRAWATELVDSKRSSRP
jgi:hypothetical protein